MKAQHADTQTRTGVQPRLASTLRNGRVPQQKVLINSNDGAVSGFEPRTYQSEQSNFCLPLGLEPKTTLNQTTSVSESSPKANTHCHQSSYKNPAILTPIKNKDIKHNNNKKKKRKKGRSRVQIPSESDDEYNSKEDDDESVSVLPGLQERN